MNSEFSTNIVPFGIDRPDPVAESDDLNQIPHRNKKVAETFHIRFLVLSNKAIHPQAIISQS